MKIIAMALDASNSKLRVYTEELNMTWSFKSPIKMYTAHAILDEMGYTMALSDCSRVFAELNKRKIESLKDACDFVISTKYRYSDM